MAELLLPSGHIALIDDADLPLVQGLKWHAHKGRGGLIYVRRVVRHGRKGPRDRYLLHRVILGLGPGREPQVDHRDGNGLDCRRSNLRLATPAQNAQNSAVRSCVDFKGISRVHRRVVGVTGRVYIYDRWQGEIRADGVRYRGPWRRLREDAVRDYDELARKHHGEFARLNFPQASHALDGVTAGA